MIQPINDRILVKVEELEAVTSGGLYLPDVAREDKNMGKVVGVGEGILLGDGTVRPLPVKEEDVIMYNKNAGTEVTIDGGKYRIIQIRDVLGKVK